MLENQPFKNLGTKIGDFFAMEVSSLLYIVLVYLILVFAVVLVASRRRINLFKAFVISLLLTPIVGIIALSRASRKVLVTHYNPLTRCVGCPYLDKESPEVCESCEFIGKLTDKLSIKRKYFI